MPFRRIFSILFAASLGVSAASAQDLQYRTVMHVNMPGMAMDMPTPAMTIYMKGALMRVDNDVDIPGRGPMRTSMIINKSTHKAFMLQHDEKLYYEMDTPLAGNDSMVARVQKNMAEPNITDTHEQMQIGKYTAHRVVMTSEMPSGIPMPFGAVAEGKKVLYVIDAWVSSDSVLNAAHKRVAAAMLENSNDPFSRAWNDTRFGGFPLKTSVLMVQVPKEGAVDAQALLKAGDSVEGLIMRMQMDALDFSFAPLDAALFAVPPDYKKAEMPK